MRAVPNMMVLEPSGPECHAASVRLALEWDGPAYLHMKRPERPPEGEIAPRDLKLGKGAVRRDGCDATIIAAGIEVAEAMAAAAALDREGISVRVVDMASIKPLDAELVLDCARETGAIVTAENHSVIGGLGSAIAETLAEAGIGLPFRRIGVQDRFCEGGSTAYLLKKFGMDSAAIAGSLPRCCGQEALNDELPPRIRVGD